MKINKRRKREKMVGAAVGLLLILAGLFWMKTSQKVYAVVDKKAYRARKVDF